MGLKNNELALIFKGLSWILSNQVKIMEELEMKLPYSIENSNELSRQYGYLAEAYYAKDNIVKE